MTQIREARADLVFKSVRLWIEPRTLTRTQDGSRMFSLSTITNISNKSGSDDGYNELYFDVLGALDDAVAADVDLVDVWTMSPQFAHIVFADGERLIGTDNRQAYLEAELAGEPPTFKQARERVAAAATRLRKNRS